MVYLKSGSSGPLITRLQTVLNHVLDPSPKLAVDGIFGPKTLEAVLAFQKHVGVAADGIVGPMTSKSLVGSVVRQTKSVMTVKP
jgi:peptidoglycan hydrolase-like protein with peptidoglycan-binding domain